MKKPAARLLSLERLPAAKSQEQMRIEQAFGRGAKPLSVQRLGNIRKTFEELQETASETAYLTQKYQQLVSDQDLGLSSAMLAAMSIEAAQVLSARCDAITATMSQIKASLAAGLEEDK